MLVLDLDKTLLHATTENEKIGPNPLDPDVATFTLPGSTLVYFAKLRQFKKSMKFKFSISKNHK